MSFALMVYDGCSAAEKLRAPNLRPTSENWKSRETFARNFGDYLKQNYLKLLNQDDPFHRFQYAIGKSMCATTLLRALRPTQERSQGANPYGLESERLLQAAMDNLRASHFVHDDPEFSGWAWMAWVQWHALATILAALCYIRSNDKANAAWYYVEKSISRVSSNIADGKSGMHWRAIELLYGRALTFKNAGSTTNSAEQSSADSMMQMEMIDAPAGFAGDAIATATFDLLPISTLTPSNIHKEFDLPLSSANFPRNLDDCWFGGDDPMMPSIGGLIPPWPS